MVLLFGFKEVFVFFALPSVVVVAVVAVIYLTYCRQQYEKSVVGVPKPALCEYRHEICKEGGLGQEPQFPPPRGYLNDDANVQFVRATHAALRAACNNIPGQ